MAKKSRKKYQKEYQNYVKLMTFLKKDSSNVSVKPQDTKPDNK